MKDDLEKRFESMFEEDKKPVSNIYNKPFLVGVLFTLATFVILNIISFSFAYFDTNIWGENGINSGLGSVTICINEWGFPFPIYLSLASNSQVSVIGLTLNIIVIAFFSFLSGFLFRFIWSKISYRFVKVS